MNDLHFFLLLLCIVVAFTLIESQSQWYYTRRIRNENYPTGIIPFEGSSFSYDQLFDNQTNDQPVLYGGGMVLQRETEENALFNNDTILYLIKNVTLLAKDNSNQVISDYFAVQYNILIVNNYSNVPSIKNSSELNAVEEEIGLYEHATQTWLERKWRFTRLGMFLTVKLNLTTAVTNEGQQENAYKDYEHHKIIATIDMAGKPTLIYHSFTREKNDSRADGKSVQDQPQENAKLDPQEQVAASSAEVAQEEGKGNAEDILLEMNPQGELLIPSRKLSVSSPSSSSHSAHHHNPQNHHQLRVMTYNLWHNNPPSWVYHVRRMRWERYEKRLKLFAENIVEHDPDISTIQEVRLDAGFVSYPSGRVVYSSDNPNPSNNNGTTATTVDNQQQQEHMKLDGGSQVEHLLAQLRDAWQRKGKGGYPDYHVVFQPANLLKER
jgi:hypothetical protein